MRYRSLSESLCRDLVRELLANGQPLIQGTDQGTGSRVVDWGLIRDTSEWMKGQIETAEWKHRDPTEGRLAIRLHQALDHVDPEVLDDAGFWRYLGLRYFWEVIRWREPHAFKGPDTSEKAIRYVGAIKPIESVLTRMYLRAVALGTSAAQPGDEGRLAYALPAATDFWRSHVTRVRTATAPPLVRAFVRRQKHERMTTDLLRVFAKAINRTWTNVELSEYDETEAARLLDELARTVQHDPDGQNDGADAEKAAR